MRGAEAMESGRRAVPLSGWLAVLVEGGELVVDEEGVEVEDDVDSLWADGMLPGGNRKQARVDATSASFARLHGHNDSPKPSLRMGTCLLVIAVNCASAASLACATGGAKGTRDDGAD